MWSEDNIQEELNTIAGSSTYDVKDKEQSYIPDMNSLFPGLGVVACPSLLRFFYVMTLPMQIHMEENGLKDDAFKRVYKFSWKRRIVNESPNAERIFEF